MHFLVPSRDRRCPPGRSGAADFLRKFVISWVYVGTQTLVLKDALQGSAGVLLGEKTKFPAEPLERQCVYSVGQLG